MARHASTNSFRQQRGFSLIELMIALVIGLLITAAVTALLINSSRTHSELTATSRQVENGRYAMQLLNDEIRHAGYYGRLFTVNSPGGSVPDPCPDNVDAAQLLDALPLHIQAHDSAASVSCLDAANHIEGTPILVLRRVDSAATASPDAGTFYLQAQPTQSVLDDDPENFTLTEQHDDTALAPIRRYHVDIYHLAPCANLDSIASCDDDTAVTLPTLTRLRLGAGGNWSHEPLVSGIEELRYQFGIDEDGDGIPNTDLAMPTATDDWFNTVTVKIHLLARAIEPSHAYTDNKVYALGDTTLPAFNDEYRRRVFANTVRIINPASRRE